jgi:hypothetical protein
VNPACFSIRNDSYYLSYASLRAIFLISSSSCPHFTIHSEVSEGEFSDTPNTSAFVQMALDTLSIPTMSIKYKESLQQYQEARHSASLFDKGRPDGSNRMAEGLVGLWNYYTIISHGVLD